MNRKRPLIDRIKSLLWEGLGLAWYGGLFCLIGFLWFTVFTREKPMYFEYVGNGGNCAGCEWISAEGRITLKTADQFRQFVEDNKIDFPIAVLLNSNGGSVVGAMDLGRVFNEKGFRIYVGKTVPDEFNHHQEVKGKCLNECVVAYLGGKDRTSSEGEIGATDILNRRAMDIEEDKRFKGMGELDQQREVSSMLVNYLVDMNVDPRFFSIASTRRKGEKLFTKAEIADLKLNASTELVTSWSLVPYRNGLVVINKDTYGVVHSVISCSKVDPTPKMFVNIGEDEDFDFYNDEIKTQDEVNFGKTTVAAGSFRLNKRAQKSVLEIDIPDVSVLEQKDQENLSISFTTAMYKMNQFYWHFPKKGLSKIVVAALKQCID